MLLLPFLRNVTLNAIACFMWSDFGTHVPLLLLLDVRLPLA